MGVGFTEQLQENTVHLCKLLTAGCLLWWYHSGLTTLGSWVWVTPGLLDIVKWKLRVVYTVFSYVSTVLEACLSYKRERGIEYVKLYTILILIKYLLWQWTCNFTELQNKASGLDQTSSYSIKLWLDWEHFILKLTTIICPNLFRNSTCSQDSWMISTNG
jgi:hypothetical protein